MELQKIISKEHTIPLKGIKTAIDEAASHVVTANLEAETR